MIQFKNQSTLRDTTYTRKTQHKTQTNTLRIFHLNLPKLRHRITRVTATLSWYIIPSPRPFDHCATRSKRSHKIYMYIIQNVD